MLELIEGFMSSGELIPLDVASEVTGLTYDELRSLCKGNGRMKIVKLDYSDSVKCKDKRRGKVSNHKKRVRAFMNLFLASFVH